MSQGETQFCPETSLLPTWTERPSREEEAITPNNIKSQITIYKCPRDHFWRHSLWCHVVFVHMTTIMFGARETLQVNFTKLIRKEKNVMQWGNRCQHKQTFHSRELD